MSRSYESDDRNKKRKRHSQKPLKHRSKHIEIEETPQGLIDLEADLDIKTD